MQTTSFFPVAVEVRELRPGEAGEARVARAVGARRGADPRRAPEDAERGGLGLRDEDVRGTVAIEVAAGERALLLAALGGLAQGAAQEGAPAALERRVGELGEAPGELEDRQDVVAVARRLRAAPRRRDLDTADLRHLDVDARTESAAGAREAVAQRRVVVQVGVDQVGAGRAVEVGDEDARGRRVERIERDRLAQALAPLARAHPEELVGRDEEQVLEPVAVEVGALEPGAALAERVDRALVLARRGAGDAREDRELAAFDHPGEVVETVAVPVARRELQHSLLDGEAAALEAPAVRDRVRAGLLVGVGRVGGVLRQPAEALDARAAVVDEREVPRPSPSKSPATRALVPSPTL
jgi:hypothetical protein